MFCSAFSCNDQLGEGFLFLFIYFLPAPFKFRLDQKTQQNSEPIHQVCGPSLRVDDSGFKYLCVFACVHLCVKGKTIKCLQIYGQIIV